MSARDKSCREFEPTTEMTVWIESLIDGDITAEQHAALPRFLMEDMAARRYFLDELQLHAALQWDGIERFDNSVEVTSGQAHSAPILPFLTPTTFHGTVGNFFSSGWPVAYLVATVIFGIGLLIGSLVHVSQPAQIARQSSLPSRVDVEPKPELVGRITDMVDCEWEEGAWGGGRGAGGKHLQSLIPNPQSLVSLGDKFVLSSGLMEITYDTGAKVVLQGPVTYEVESASGGYLALGKLTARLEKKTAASNPQSLIPNPPLSTNHNPLFTIKTPTAIVTDIGTEFGVEVRDSGDTSTHVFRGAVEVQPVGDDGRHQALAVRLTENQSALVEKSRGGNELTVHRGTADRVAFVRLGQFRKLAEEQEPEPFRRWQAYSRQLRKDPSLLAYYDFQREPGSLAVLRNVATNGDRSADGVIENARWTTGRMPGKHALVFNGLQDCVRVNLLQPADNLTLAASIHLMSVGNLMNGILMSDAWGRNGAIHWQVGADNQLWFDLYGIGEPGRFAYSSEHVLDWSHFLRQWIHVAVTYDHAEQCIRFYVNGEPAGEAQTGGPNQQIPIHVGSACIGRWDAGDFVASDKNRNLCGRIDELAVFGRVLSPDDIRRISKAGKEVPHDMSSQE